MAEGQKEYKKLRPPLLPVERWVRLPKGNGSNAVPKKTMPGKVLEASRNHQDEWPYGGPDSPKTKKMQGSKSRKTIKTLHIAVTTRGQLQAPEENITTHGSTVRCDKILTTETSPSRKIQSEDGTNNLTAEATLDKDAAGRKMTDWEYLM